MATRDQLRQTAREINKLMDLKPAIKMSQKVGALKDDIIEACDELRDDDKFSPEVEQVLVELEIRKTVDSMEGQTEAPPETKPPTGGVGEKSRYGHRLGSQGALLDDILFEGATLDEAAKKVDVKVGRVRGHLKHLQNDKGLTLVETGDTVKIKEATV